MISRIALAIAGLSVLAGIGLFIAETANAQGCQTIFMPGGQIVTCCRTGNITNCF